MKLRQNGTVFLMIKRAALAAKFNSEPQNSRISNRRISKDGVASLNLFLK
jgi:hypothetical protein